MLETRYFRSWCVLLVSIAVLHFAGLKLFLYWTIPWYDILLHFLGGLWVGVGVICILYTSGYAQKKPWLIRLRPFIVFGIVLVVGLLWEAYEYIFKLTSSHGYVFDTILDLIMDLLGGLVAVMLPVLGKKNEYER